MSTELHRRIQETLRSPLVESGHDLVDVVALPEGDRLTRMRAIQEILADLDTHPGSSDYRTYLVQVRKHVAPAAASAPNQPANATMSIEAIGSSDSAVEGVYRADGKLNTEYLLSNARILFSAGEYALARQIYETLIRAGSETAQALFLVARCYEAEGRLPEAIHHYEDSILYHPTLESYRRYATLLIRGGKDQQAAEALERALMLKDLPTKARFELHQAAGHAWLRSRLPAKAERHYRKAQEADPRSDKIASNLAALMLQQGKLEDAKQAFMEALDLNPRSAVALAGIASCFLAAGDRRQAHDYFAKSLRIKLDQPKAIFHLVKCAFETKQYASAAEILADYIGSAPFNANLLYSLAGLHFHLGRLDDARKVTTQILSLQPGHAEARRLSDLIEKQQTAV